MHAQVRRILLQNESWDVNQLGMPINQLYLATTAVLFSSVMLDGVSRMGANFAAEERENLAQLWRYVARQIGVLPELCAGGYEEGLRLAYITSEAHGPCDEDSRRLVHALLGKAVPTATTRDERKARLVTRLCHAVSRRLLGDRLADELELASGYGWDRALALLKPVLATYSVSQRVGQTSRNLALRAGLRTWEAIVDEGLVAARRQLSDSLEADPAGSSSQDLGERLQRATQ